MPEPEDPEPEPPKQSDQVGIGKPSGFLSWDKRAPAPTPPPFPWPTQPNQIGLEPVHATVIWDKRQEDVEPEEPEDDFPEDPDFPSEPEEPEEPVPVPTQPNSIGIQPPTATVIWGKRQEETEPIEEPKIPDDEFPEEPEEPVPAPTQPNTIGLEPPVATVIWSKRQDDDFPEDPDFPEEPEEPVPAPTQPNTIGLEPPVATVIWGKRQDVSLPVEQAPEPTATGPFEIPPLPVPTQPNSNEVGQPTATVIWGRDAAPAPTALARLQDRDAAAQFTCGSTTTAYPIKACPKIPCKPECHYSPEFLEPVDSDPIDTVTGIPKCPVTKTLTNVCPICVCPTPPPAPTKTPTLPTPACPLTTVTTTVTIKPTPTCAAPTCPPRATPCDLNRPVPRMEKVVRSIVTVVPIVPTPKPTKCGTVTKTLSVAVGCPTYTCVPGCDAARVVR